ncbi:MAG: hypothetical protein D6797_03440, partial [Bdellovibrio sp.]
FVEGGAYTHNVFLAHNKAHRLYQYIAPLIIGSGLKWQLEVTKRLQKMSSKCFGEDLFVTGRLA